MLTHSGHPQELPADVGIHLPTSEGWKAKWALSKQGQTKFT